MSTPSSEPPPGQPPGPQTGPETELEHDAVWRRLDLRMLLVHPVNEVIRFLPFLVGVFLLGSGGEDGGPWHYLGVAVPIAIGLFRFFSTRFRITSGQIELRRGILGRSVLTAPLDRVRTVELTASPIHRVLQLEKVVIGTGSAGSGSSGGLTLDALGNAEAHRLRAELLDRAGSTVPAEPGEIASVAPGEVLLRFDPGWARYAPLTTSGLLVALAAVGAAAGPFFGNNLEVRVANSSAVDQVREVALPLLLGAGLVGLLVIASVLGILGYLLGNWDFTLTRNSTQRTFDVRRGALTTRATTIDLDRLRGVEVHEPLGLRLAGGGRLNAVVTGFGRRTAESKSPLVPAAPQQVVHGVAELVLEERSPLEVPLSQHGPAARRRRYLRAVVPGLVVVAVLVLAAAAGDWPWPLAVLSLALPVAGAFLARDRYRRLGHALTPGYVVVRWGSLRGRRDALARTGIIGWNITQTFFQRRAGLVSLTATTAAGQQSYEILDVPEDVAVAFAAEAVPGLVEQFLTRQESAPPAR
ncbi:putative membrane protein [Marmoricola sp. OAE513]|uniref:PH domain-containing protein n=1 Tax=Marmoricola sp. OAE513 TaxID=2817894 RepID=UPI001AE3D1ED